MKVVFPVSDNSSSAIEKIPADIVQGYHRALFEHREALDDDAYKAEQRFLSFIKRGDIKGLKKLTTQMGSKFLVSRFSPNELRQAQYMMCVGVTLLTRAAIEGGMLVPEAFNLSDVYMQQIDRFKTPKEMPSLMMIAAMDFTSHVHHARLIHSVSPIVIKCRSYVSDHLHEHIKITGLASLCGITPQYLSSHFKRETGLTISQYILNEKLETARLMLEDTHYTVHEIAYYLAFPSHSNFSTAFSRKYGRTPKIWRTAHGSTDLIE
jgi:AraC-like DNA-binding protein